MESQSQTWLSDWTTATCKIECSQPLKIRCTLKVLKTELPYEPAVPLLSTYSRQTKTLIWKDICTPMFIIALFTIAMIWKQTKCPSAGGRIEKMRYTHKHTHAMEYRWAIKRNEHFPFATIKMDLYFSKWHKSDRERKRLYDITYMWNLKNKTN